MCVYQYCQCLNENIDDLWGKLKVKGKGWTLSGWLRNWTIEEKNKEMEQYIQV